MTTTEIVVVAIGATVTGCLWAVCWAAVRIAQVNAGKGAGRDA